MEIWIMEIWKNESLEKQKFGNVEKLKLGKMDIRKNENWEKCRMVKKEIG